MSTEQREEIANIRQRCYTNQIHSSQKVLSGCSLHGRHQTSQQEKTTPSASGTYPTTRPKFKTSQLASNTSNNNRITLPASPMRNTLSTTSKKPHIDTSRADTVSSSQKYRLGGKMQKLTDYSATSTSSTPTQEPNSPLSTMKLAVPKCETYPPIQVQIPNSSSREKLANSDQLFHLRNSQQQDVSCKAPHNISSQTTSTSSLEIIDNQIQNKNTNQHQHANGHIDERKSMSQSPLVISKQESPCDLNEAVSQNSQSKPVGVTRNGLEKISALIERIRASGGPDLHAHLSNEKNYADESLASPVSFPTENKPAPSNDYIIDIEQDQWQHRSSHNSRIQLQPVPNFQNKFSENESNLLHESARIERKNSNTAKLSPDVHRSQIAETDSDVDSLIMQTHFIPMIPSPSKHTQPHSGRFHHQKSPTKFYNSRADTTDNQASYRPRDPVSVNHYHHPDQYKPLQSVHPLTLDAAATIIAAAYRAHVIRRMLKTVKCQSIIQTIMVKGAPLI